MGTPTIPTNVESLYLGRTDAQDPRRRSPLGVQVAKAILSGDVSLARSLAFGCYGWSVAEGRAIVGACRAAQARFEGCSVQPAEFF